MKFWKEIRIFGTSEIDEHPEISYYFIDGVWYPLASLKMGPTRRQTNYRKRSRSQRVLDG